MRTTEEVELQFPIYSKNKYGALRAWFANGNLYKVSVYESGSAYKACIVTKEYKDPNKFASALVPSTEELEILGQGENAATEEEFCAAFSRANAGFTEFRRGLLADALSAETPLLAEEAS